MMRRSFTFAAQLFTCLIVATPQGSATDFPVAPGAALQAAPAIAHDASLNRYLTV